ncbi:MAG TPA: hypothetical protein PLR06_09765, partial [Cyclobacteriaceae bacterium]|nr:hypothetical protein [Cyclobacteriaceae bacterium]
EGLDMMGFRNERYLALSNRDPQNIFYGRTDFKTVFAGLSQLFTHLLGIGFQNIGWRIRETLPILILPALLIFLNRRFLLEGKALMTSLALFILAAPLVATLMAFVSGHTVAYQVLYASFSVPFGCILMGILSDKIILTGKPMTRIILFLFVGVMILSAWTNINSIRHGYSSEISLPDRAKSIEKKYHQGDTLRFSSVDEALLMNLYFEKKDMLQIVHSDSLYTKYPSDRVVRKVYSPLP